MQILSAKGTIEVPATNAGAGAAVDFSEAGPGSTYLQLTGTFSATYKIEGSIDDGATWQDLGALFFDASTGSPAGSAIAAPGLFFYISPGRPPQKLRWKNVSFSSGAPVGHYSYRWPL